MHYLQYDNPLVEFRIALGHQQSGRPGTRQSGLFDTLAALGAPFEAHSPYRPTVRILLAYHVGVVMSRGQIRCESSKRQIEGTEPTERRITHS